MFKVIIQTKKEVYTHFTETKKEAEAIYRSMELLVNNNEIISAILIDIKNKIIISHVFKTMMCSI